MDVAFVDSCNLLQSVAICYDCPAFPRCLTQCSIMTTTGRSEKQHEMISNCKFAQEFEKAKHVYRNEFGAKTQILESEEC